MAKQPTNQDLLKEIKAMSAIVSKIDGRVFLLETWKIATDAASAAVDKYKANENKTSDSWINKELIKVLAIALGAIVSLIALIRTSK